MVLVPSADEEDDASEKKRNHRLLLIFMARVGAAAAVSRKLAKATALLEYAHLATTKHA